MNSQTNTNTTSLYVADKHPVDEALGCFVPVAFVAGIIGTITLYLSSLII